MAQMPAYVETAEQSWRETALQCAAFSVGDAALILAIYAIAVTTAPDTKHKGREVLFLGFCTGCYWGHIYRIDRKRDGLLDLLEKHANRARLGPLADLAIDDSCASYCLDASRLKGAD